jgi:hypothetical protein
MAALFQANMVQRKRRAEASEEIFIRLDMKHGLLGILRHCRGITDLTQDRKKIISGRQAISHKPTAERLPLPELTQALPTFIPQSNGQLHGFINPDMTG